MIDRNDLAFWFPILKASGVEVPETHIVKAPMPIPDKYNRLNRIQYGSFASRLVEAGWKVGYPCFLRTGHTSG